MRNFKNFKIVPSELSPNLAMIRVPDIFLTCLVGTIYRLEGLNKRLNVVPVFLFFLYYYFVFFCLLKFGSSVYVISGILGRPRTARWWYGLKWVSTCFHISNRPLPFHLHLHEISNFLDSETWGAFHLSELTGQTLPVVMKISLLIKTILLHQSNPK